MRIIITFSFLVIAAHLSVRANPSVTFNFDTDNPLSSPLISGNKQNFGTTTEQSHSTPQSIKYVDPAPEPFESWAYDAPFALTSGSVTIWFYDSRGAAAFNPYPPSAKWGGSVILEDKNSPQDFAAVEISELPYGGGRYYGSEGVVDRQTTGVKFDSASFPSRSTGWHKIMFEINAAQSLVYVDGQVSSRVGGPGGGQVLRLRVMCGSAGNGSAPPGTPGLPPGYQPNWFLTPPGTAFAPPTAMPWIYYDDLNIAAEQPLATIHTMGFEINSGPPPPEYVDTNAIPMGPDARDLYDNPYMDDYVNQWDVTTSVSRTGLRSGYFANHPPAFRSIAFDLAGAANGSEAVVWFYDARGPESLQTKYGGSVMIESSLDRAEFMSMEVWNFPYPASGDPTPGGPNYYLTQGFKGTYSNFYSRIFGNRTIGWHEVRIGLSDTYSTMTVDGYGDPTKHGPGLDKSPRLRLMADSPTLTGYSNYITANPLTNVFFETLEPYIYYDDVTLPVELPSAVRDWSLYETP
ncbi:MAG: hypothetical protein WCK47_02730 [bacterium]